MDQHAPAWGDSDSVPAVGADQAPSRAPEDAGPEPTAEPTAAGAETPMETDASVPTEVVEVPAVTLATPEPVGPRRVSGRVSVVTALIAVVAIGGIGVFGYTTNQDLGATRATLETTRTDLASTTSTLESTAGSLVERTTVLKAARQEHSDLDARIADLSAEVADQTACLKLQTTALDELGRIEQLQTENFNRTTEGTTWAKADIAIGKAVDLALDEYYQAYSKAFQGATSTARSRAANGKAAEAKIVAQEKIQKAEQAIVDAKAAEISTALDALEAQLASADSACAEVTR